MFPTFNRLLGDRRISGGSRTRIACTPPISQNGSGATQGGRPDQAGIAAELRGHHRRPAMKSGRVVRERLPQIEEHRARLR